MTRPWSITDLGLASLVTLVAELSLSLHGHYLLHASGIVQIVIVHRRSAISLAPGCKGAATLLKA